MKLTKTFELLVILFLFLSVNLAFASNWPTYQQNASRSCIAQENLTLPLNMQWKYQVAVAPKPAWAKPAKTDFWHREENLKPRVIFDKAYHVISADGKIYFGSSAEDKIYCLDANTGEEKWSYFTSAPVRLAPTYSNGLLYTGSDDGVVYCLNAESGELVWKLNAGEGKRFIPGNERMISISPIRTGVLVDDGTAYFCSGIFPNEGVELYAVSANNGNVIWKKSDIGISPQGYMLASKNNLYIPTGRTTPKVFSRKDGEFIGDFEGNGGTYALLVNDELIFGGGDEGILNNNIPNKSDDDEIASFLGLQIIVRGDTSFLRSDTELSAISRGKYIEGYEDWADVEKKKSDLADDLWDLREQRKLASKDEIEDIDEEIFELIEKISQFDDKRKKIEAGGLIWKQKIDGSYSMILAGKLVVVGSNGKVEIYNSENGKKIWNQKVDGVVYSLAISDGKLLVSTDKGTIYSFGGKSISNPIINSNKNEKNPYKNEPNGELYSSAVKEIIKTKIDKGYCLVVGSETGHLAYEIAKKTNLKVIGIEEDPIKVEKSRRLLNKAGIYGDRVTILSAPLTDLPLSKYFANLIVSDKMLLTGELQTSANEIYRVLKPYGGVAMMSSGNKDIAKLKSWIGSENTNEWLLDENKWAVIERGGIKGAGEWTHLYADPGNTACSDDSVQGPFQIQWFGKPGPREMINRHSRPMSPLFKNGRLFIPGDNRIICVDSYNGTLLWKRYVPDSRVLGALRDSGTMAVADDFIYIAAGQTALGFDVANGDQDITLEVPQVVKGQESKWGYLVIVDDQIFGSGKKPNASVTILGRNNCDAFEGDYRDMITSDFLFSLDRRTGEEFWTYKGLVFNNTITIGGDYIYFVESRSKDAIEDFDGRLRVDHFCDGPTYIVKLDKQTGEKVWEKEYEFPYSQIMFLSFSKNTLLVTGSYNIGANVHYKLFAFNGDDGSEIWATSYKGGKKDGSHGEQWQHPVIIGDEIFLLPYIFSLETGKQGDLFLSRGGCGGFSGSATNLFARNSNPRYYDITGEQSGNPLTQVNRPGCWINIIPAGNIISIPEASSGCTCDYPIQTSFGFVSKN